MRPVLDIILLILQIYIWLLIAAAVFVWLVAFMWSIPATSGGDAGRVSVRSPSGAARPIRS